MRGHEEASGTAYVPPHLFEEWAKKDPLARFESLLKSKGVLTTFEIETLRAKIKAEIDQMADEALESPSALARARVPPQPSSPSSGWGATTKRSSIPFLQNPPKRLRERGHLVGHNIPKGSVVQGEVGVG